MRPKRGYRAGPRFGTFRLSFHEIPLEKPGGNDSKENWPTASVAAPV